MLVLTFHGVLEEFVIEVWNDAIRVDHATEDVGEVSSDRHLKFKELGGAGRIHHQLLNARTLSCPRRSISGIITQHQWRR